MNTSTRSFSTSGTLAELSDRAFDHLRNMGYRPGTLVRYRATWRAFVGFAETRGEGELTQDLVVNRQANGTPDRRAKGTPVPASMRFLRTSASEVMRLSISDPNPAKKRTYVAAATGDPTGAVGTGENRT